MESHQEIFSSTVTSFCISQYNLCIFLIDIHSHGEEIFQKFTYHLTRHNLTLGCFTTTHLLPWEVFLAGHAVEDCWTCLKRNHQINWFLNTLILSQNYKEKLEIFLKKIRLFQRERGNLSHYVHFWLLTPYNRKFKNINPEILPIWASLCFIHTVKNYNIRLVRVISSQYAPHIYLYTCQKFSVLVHDFTFKSISEACYFLPKYAAMWKLLKPKNYLKDNKKNNIMIIWYLVTTISIFIMLLCEI